MNLKYKVENQILRAVGCMRQVVELSRNLVLLELEFDAEWDGAAITVLFSNDFVENGKIYQQIWNNEPVPVPTEVLETGMLRIGCVGLLDGGETRITTARMERGVQILQCGGLIGVDPDSQTPELWEQILASMGQLGDLQTEDKSSLVAAINEVLQSGGTGSVDPADIAQAVEDYLSKNPVQEKDPTVPAWAKETEKPSYTAQEVGADPSGTAAGLVDAHNTAEAAHNDIRLLISGLTERLNALADSDDTTLDQLSEVVAYIKANRELIASITTDKVSVADIINDLVTNVTNKPLSAAQGVALKAMIDAISIPEKLPNPNALTFTGAATGSYDGSKSLTVNVPSLTIDPTVTQPGQAADAAAVRDEINSLSGKIVTEAEAKVTAHNTGTDTHSDIRLLIQGLTDRLNALADSDDTTLDQLSEVVEYIKANRDLISSITTDKVSVSDIIDNLTTNVSNKPLSAAQGVALKALIDAISIPEKLPNPNALTFTGAVEGSYDGSAPLEVVIPSGGGGGGSNIIFDSGEISEEVNLIGPIDISAYSKIRIFGKAYPSANSAGKKAAQLYFGNNYHRLLCNAGSNKLFDTSGNPVSFLIYLDVGANAMSTHSYSGYNASGTFDDADYAVSSQATTADGSCLVYSTTYDLTQMYLSAQDDLSGRPWGVNTRIMVIGDA